MPFLLTISALGTFWMLIPHCTRILKSQALTGWSRQYSSHKTPVTVPSRMLSFGSKTRGFGNHIHNLHLSVRMPPTGLLAVLFSSRPSSIKMLGYDLRHGEPFELPVSLEWCPVRSCETWLPAILELCRCRFGHGRHLSGDTCDCDYVLATIRPLINLACATSRIGHIGWRNKAMAE